MFALLAGLASTVVTAVSDGFKRKQELKQAIAENKMRLARSDQTHNQDWEMRQLDNCGWKDDVLFYAWIIFFAWTGYDPEGAKEVFDAWALLPDWFLKISFWIVGSVLGVKKVGDYLPGVIRGIKDAVKK